MQRAWSLLRQREETVGGLLWALVLTQLGDLTRVRVLMMAASAPSRVSQLICAGLPGDSLSASVGFQEQLVPELQANKRQVATLFPFSSHGRIHFFFPSLFHSYMGVFDFS